ncbi:MAG: gamma-glutamyltransferase [Gordonia sp.]|nr:gamma-glutamyltransferase [Gordonia sp. (in: high G+C Gram-positive bacteria)]
MTGPVFRPRAGAVAFIVTALLLAVSCSTSSDEAASPDQVCALPESSSTSVTAPSEPEGATEDISTNPEVATGYRSDMTAVQTKSFAAATANPLATQAACEVLAGGGDAADALVAAQMVLGLVEPQSSGIGGGAFALYYDAAEKSVQAYDGREVAPAAATENYLRWVDDINRTEPVPSARESGRSIGVPGVLRLLEDVQSEHGTNAWRSLFEPATSLADSGFAISPRMAAAIDESSAELAVDPAAKSYFLLPDGSGKPAGEVLTNPAYSKTLGAIASEGADAFYSGDIAEAIVAKAGSTAGGMTPSAMTIADLQNYESKVREPICVPYRDVQVCGMPNPSSGGLAVASTLGILSNFPMDQYPPTAPDLNGGKPSAMGVHLVSEAERLAYADRDKYIADSDFVPLPGGSPAALLDPAYLKGRATLINPDRSMGTATAGQFDAAAPVGWYSGVEHGTSHISVVDKEGNAASMTTTVESSFGSFHMVDGFLLNNQLTDFSAEPTDPQGLPLVNRVEPNKRPRSSMAPTLVFGGPAAGGEYGDLKMVVGSPGGSVIIQFVVKTLVGLMDWGMDPQQAVSMVDFGAANTPSTNVGGEHPNIDTADDGNNDPLVQGLRAKGHEVDLDDQSSGLSALLRTEQGWSGGADPRREGIVLGDTP